jgi:putative transposase
VSKKAGRYYVSVLVDMPGISMGVGPMSGLGIGIDLGLTEFAVSSDGMRKANINKGRSVKRAEKKLRREQRKLSRQYESLKEREKGKQKGEATRKNIEKQVIVVQRLHQRLSNIRTDYIDKIVSEVVRTKPNYVTIEDLNVSGMMKNRHLSKAIAGQKFREFRTKLTAKCKVYGIELRVVDRFYPSSKKCHECGSIKADLTLKDRVYICPCGYKADRDYNASLNLRDAKVYSTA